MISTTRLAISNIILDLSYKYKFTVELPELIKEILELFDPPDQYPGLIKKQMEELDSRSISISRVARKIGFNNAIEFWEDLSKAVYEESRKKFYISHPLKLESNEYELD